MISRRALLLAPGLAWLTALLVLPCALIFVLGFFERGVYGGIDYTFTTENFVRAADPLYAGIFLYSARIALTAVLVSLLIGYPAAYCIAQQPKRFEFQGGGISHLEGGVILKEPGDCVLEVPGTRAEGHGGAIGSRLDHVLATALAVQTAAYEGDVREAPGGA